MRRIELALANKADLAKAGAVKMSDSGRAGGRGNKKGLSTVDKPFDEPTPKHDTRAEIAAEAGVSTGQVGMAEVVPMPPIWP